MKKEVIYQEFSGTIRQMPENYCLAYRRNGSWVCDPDPAANWRIVLKLFKMIFRIHEVKWGTGEHLIMKFKKL